MTYQLRKLDKADLWSFANDEYLMFDVRFPPFTKSGAILSPVMEWTSDGGATWWKLKEGTDYKLSFKNNKTVNTNGLMSTASQDEKFYAVVKGIGSYNGTIYVPYSAAAAVKDIS